MLAAPAIATAPMARRGRRSNRVGGRFEGAAPEAISSVIQLG